MCSIPGLPTPGSEVPVLITRVNLNSTCGLVELWVNIDDGRKHVYEEMREEIQTSERKFCGSEGKVGDLCLVCITDVWHRARIVSTQDETCNVFLIDQGQPHTTTSKALAWGQSDSFLLPPETESCILANALFLENNWPEKATTFLESLAGKTLKGLVQHVLMPDRIIVLDIPVVSKHMCEFGVAKKLPVDEFKCLVQKCLEAERITEEQNLNDQYFYPELLTETFETVQVTEVTNPYNIFCKLLIFSKAVKILSDQIQQHYEESSDFREMPPLNCGDPCAAKGMNGRWHRSLLKQTLTSEGTVEVLHVDEGKIEVVAVGDIRALHGKFLRMPVVTYHCTLDGVKANGTGWTTDQTDYLKSLLLNQTVVAKFNHHNTLQDVYPVILYADNASCINECFIKKTGPFSPSKTERDSVVQNEPIPPSVLGSLGDEHCMDLQNRVLLNASGLKEETLTCTKNLAVNDRANDLSMSETDDTPNKDREEHLDPLIQINGQHSTDFPSEEQNAFDDEFSVGSTVNVKVSFIESLQKFWCQKLETADSLRILMQDLQNHYASAHPQPLVESICVARNPGNDMWYRAKILASQDFPVVDVRFIDYGQTRTVALQDVRPIDPSFLRLNAQAFQCCLFSRNNSTNPMAITQTDAAEFQKFVDEGALSNRGLKCIVKAVTSDEDGLPLNMVDIEAPPDNACKLPIEPKACIQIPEQVPSDAYSYSTHNIEVGGKETVWVTSSENVNEFYCQLDRNSCSFDKVTENIKQCMCHQKSTNHPVTITSICLAKYTDNQWYRGQVVELSPKLKVQFVDFGETLSVSESDVRPFPTGANMAKSVPVQAIPLGLFDVPAEVPQEVNQWFADHAVGQGFTISVIAKEAKGKLIVELFEGLLNVNIKVREKISKTIQQGTNGLIQQMDQQLSNSSKHANVPNENCLKQELKVSVQTNTAEQSKVHRNNEACARDEWKSQSITNVSAPETVHEKILDEGRKTNFDVILTDREKEGSHNDSEITLSLPSCPERNVNICMYKWPNIFQNKTEEVYTSCIVGPHYFWCQYINTEDLDMVSRLAQESGQAQQDMMFPSTLGPGSPCLALFSSDNQWYRAQVIRRVGDAFNVLFIDYGNESDVDVKNVRSMPQNLLEKTPLAFLCFLNGFDESKGSWDDSVYDDFHNLLVDKQLRVTVLNTKDQSESAVPQYAVDMECEGVVVNVAMQKYWKSIAKEQKTETPLQDGQTQSNMITLTVSKENGNTCMYKEPCFSKNKKEEVYASCIVEPHYFWCQYANTEELSKVTRLSQEAGLAQYDMMFPETLGPGSPCLALFSSDNQWYRAQVIRRVEDAFHVLFIDYGNESDVNIKNVRSLPQSLLEKAPQAFLCSLNGFDKSRGSWNDEVYDDFYNLLVDKPLQVTLLNTENNSESAIPQYAVEIECNGVAINAAMQNYWQSSAKEHVSIEHPQTETFLQDGQTKSDMTNFTVSKEIVDNFMYKEPCFPKNKKEEVYASCIAEPHFFWCQYANTEELSTVTRLAQEAGQAQYDMMFPETLDPGSPCLALFSSDNQWYRAQVLSRVDNTLRVLFIDYGNESDVEIENVRSLPRSLLERTPQAFLCSLNGFDKSKGSWNDEVYDDFYNLLVDKPLRVTVLNREDQSESAVPQYAVEIQCEGVVVNVAIQKYWKPVAKAHLSVEHPQTETFVQDGHTQSNLKNATVSKENGNICMYKEPCISKNKKEEVYASCIVEPHYFWCQYANTEELSKVTTLAQEAGLVQHDMMFPGTLGPGSPCLALFSSDNQWYRAQVIRRVDDALNVLFIDYGNESDVDIKNLRSLPQSLLEKAPQAFLCSLNGFDVSKGSWNDEVYDGFYNVLVDKPLTVTVFNAEDHPEIAVPQYAVEIECEGVVVNTLMEKYWKELDM